MRHRHLLIALLCAALAAIGGTLAGTLSTGAAKVGRATRVALVARVAHSAAKRHARTVVIRGSRGPAGPRGGAGPAGPVGPAGAPSPADGIALAVTINWFGSANAATYGSFAPVSITNIGTLSAECDYTAQQIVLVPSSSAGTRTVADITTMQGEGTAGISSNQRLESYGSTTPLVIPMPVNGMVTGTFSVEPDYGAGGTGPSPVSFVFSSYHKLNSTDGASDSCTVAGQLTEHSS
jgi:hypothetical protein